MIINTQPRSLKSLIASIAFPAWILGHDPTKRLIVLTYSADLGITLSNLFRIVMNAPWYRALFPETRISPMKNTETQVVTTRGGYRFSTSIGGTVTGLGGDFIILDDLLKPDDALSVNKREHVNNWFKSTLLTRPDDPEKGAIVVVMQRLHVDDLAGQLLRHSDDWNHLSLPSIADRDERIQIGSHRYYHRRAGEPLHPERVSLAKLEGIRNDIGWYHFATQYLQCQLPPGGGMIQPEWVRRYDRIPAPRGSSRTIQSWDTALKTGAENDFSACVTLVCRDRIFYVVDVLRERLDYPALKERAISLAQMHKASRILVEDTCVGTPLVAELKKLGLSAVAIKPEGDKKSRLAVQSEKFQKGQVLLPTTAIWLADLEHELFAFPHGRHDDQVDALSQALAHALLPGEVTEESVAGWEKFGMALWNHSQFMSLIGR